MNSPSTRYAKSGDLNIAYQVVGAGPLDLVYVPGWVSNVELTWEEPSVARFFERLASFSRLILFDKRGTGMSDREVGFPTLEDRMDDVRAVMDAVGSKRAALLSMSEGGNMSMLFAATYPERVAALVLFGCFAKRLWAPDYPWAPTLEERQEWYRRIEAQWGGPFDVSSLAPSRAGDPVFKDWFGRYLRMSASPRGALTLARMNTEIDVRNILPVIRVPALVLHRRDDRDALIEGGRYIADHIPGAKFVELDGADHLLWAGNQEPVLSEIEEFLTGERHGAATDRVLTTILITDIVGSTARAAALGDRQWRDLLARHYAAMHGVVERYRGRAAGTTGDGILAHFDGPARAVRCALAMVDAVRPLGLEIRAGVHTGECYLAGDEVTGIAVHIGARIAALAGPGEVLVSGTVKDLVVGAGLAFAARGMQSLKGVPDSWPVFAASLPGGA
ncbi:MAG: adenylate/guanylate cyclase domain-containing protein [Rhodospirillales bacterium]|nr:adenylate/guanylate cyclase domain-containing protein [Rhodospirillales bacterium]